MEITQLIRLCEAWKREKEAMKIKYTQAIPFQFSPTQQLGNLYQTVVSEFVLQSRYYVHFRTNTLGKDMNPLILPAMG